MRKVLKGLLFAVAGLVLLLVLAAVILPMIVDPNDYKPLIAEQVQKATGREFSIGGDIELSVFPWIGAAIEGPIVLGNAEGFGPEPMARLDAVDVKVKLLPLLRKEVFMRTVVLRGPNINLAKNERGITNWDDLVERQGKAEPTPSPAPDTGDGQATAMPKVSLGGVALDNGQVAWKDKSTGLEAVVSDLNLNVGALTLDPGTVIPIEMTCSLRANQPEASADLRLQTRANVNQQAKRATLASTDIRLSQISAVLAEGQPHLRGSTEISGDFDVAWGAGLASFSPVRVAADLSGGPIPGDGLAPTLNASGSFDWSKGLAELSTLTAAALGAEVAAKNLRAENVFKAPAVTGRITTNTFSPREVAKALNVALPIPNDKALDRLSFKGDVAYSPGSADVSNMQLMLDNTTMTGKFGVPDMSKPAVTFDLRGDSFTVDPYIPPKEKEKSDGEGKPAPSDKKKEDDEILPKEQLKALDVDGKLFMASLGFKGMTAENVNMRVKAKNGDITIDPLSMDIFRGTFDMALTTNMAMDQPPHTLKLGIESLDVAQLLSSFQDNPLVGGLARLDLDISSVGLTMWKMLRGMDGSASMGLKDGYVRGINLSKERIEQAKTGKNVFVPEEEKGARTNIPEMTTNLNIKDGIARTKDILVTTDQSGVKLTGGGLADLAEQTLNLDLKAHLGPLALPLTVQGPFSNPKTGVSASGIAEQVLTSPLDIVNGAADGVGGVLGGISGALSGSGEKKTDDGQQPPKQGEGEESQTKPSQEKSPGEEVKKLFEGFGLKPKN